MAIAIPNFDSDSDPDFDSDLDLPTTNNQQPTTNN